MEDDSHLAVCLTSAAASMYSILHCSAVQRCCLLAPAVLKEHTQLFCPSIIRLQAACLHDLHHPSPCWSPATAVAVLLKRSSLQQHKPHQLCSCLHASLLWLPLNTQHAAHFSPRGNMSVLLQLPLLWLLPQRRLLVVVPCPATVGNSRNMSDSRGLPNTCGRNECARPA